jgi:hypothetical protein
MFWLTAEQQRMPIGAIVYYAEADKFGASALQFDWGDPDLLKHC